jgi:hypothetical protein
MSGFQFDGGVPRGVDRPPWCCEWWIESHGIDVTIGLTLSADFDMHTDGPVFGRSVANQVALLAETDAHTLADLRPPRLPDVAHG